MHLPIILVVSNSRHQLAMSELLYGLLYGSVPLLKTITLYLCIGH